MAAYHRTKDRLHRTRLQAVRVYGRGYAVTETYTRTGCDRSSLMEWCRADQQHRLAGLDRPSRRGLLVWVTYQSVVSKYPLFDCAASASIVPPWWSNPAMTGGAGVRDPA